MDGKYPQYQPLEDLSLTTIRGDPPMNHHETISIPILMQSTIIELELSPYSAKGWTNL